MLETTKKQIMKKVNRVSMWVLWLAVFSAFPAIVLADESWTSNVGNIIWEKDVNNTAVFLYATPNVTKGKTRLFIRNLVPDTVGNRGSYTGYWTDDSQGELCEASLTDPIGTKTKRWGRFTITFERVVKKTPEAENYAEWNWIGFMGNCFDEPSRKITAVPATE